MREVTIFYLEMTSAKKFIQKALHPELRIEEAKIKEYRFNRYLYSLVGECWEWQDKLSLSDSQWQEYAESESVRTWVAYHKGSIAGYFELESQAEGNVEIKYFGLAPKFIGKGFGGCLLSFAIEQAWAWKGCQRVWVHTCTLDHENALKITKIEVFRYIKRKLRHE